MREIWAETGLEATSQTMGVDVQTLERTYLLLQVMDSCAGLLESLLVRVTLALTLPFDVRKSSDSVHVKSPSIVELEVVTSAVSATRDFEYVRADHTGTEIQDAYLHIDWRVGCL